MNVISVECYICNVFWKDSMKWTTTMLYKDLKKILYDLANIYWKPVKYSFVWLDRKMNKWASTAWNNIFDRDKIDGIHFNKTVYPRNKRK